jgi:hypothetical protein
MIAILPRTTFRTCTIGMLVWYVLIAIIITLHWGSLSLNCCDNYTTSKHTMRPENQIATPFARLQHPMQDCNTLCKIATPSARLQHPLKDCNTLCKIATPYARLQHPMQDCNTISTHIGKNISIHTDWRSIHRSSHNNLHVTQKPLEQRQANMRM